MWFSVDCKRLQHIVENIDHRNDSVEVQVQSDQTTRSKTLLWVGTWSESDVPVIGTSSFYCWTVVFFKWLVVYMREFKGLMVKSKNNYSRAQTSWEFSKNNYSRGSGKQCLINMPFSVVSLSDKISLFSNSINSLFWNWKSSTCKSLPTIRKPLFPQDEAKLNSFQSCTFQ